MLVPLTVVLEAAERGHFAVGAFNTSNMIFTQAIIQAAEELDAPVILQTTEKAINFATLDIIAEVAEIMAERTQIPIVLHLDHGRDASMVRRVMTYGYTSVMFDGSQLPFDENLFVTKELAEMAHRMRISIEGEVGHIGGAEDYGTEKVLKTDPKQAVKFATETKVDALAVAFGNAHGLPSAEEKLDFGLLETIHQQVVLPLVFHGASGTPEADIKQAIQCGVRKINIDTDIRQASTTAIRDYLTKHPESYDPREYLTEARQAVFEVVKKRIRQFGGAGHAKDVKV